MVLLLDFPGGPVVKALRFHCKGAQVWSLVREVLHAAAKKTLKKNAITPSIKWIDT